MRLVSKARTYLRELALARKVTGDLKSWFLLASKLAQFHWHNARQRPPQGGSPFRITIRLQDARFQLMLRPLAGDLFVLNEVMLYPHYYLPESVCDSRRVRTVVDCGANIGLASLYLANRYPNARVFAVEPHPENFELLRANTKDQPRIVPIRACIAARLGESRYITDGSAAWAYHTTDAKAGLPVPVATIDSICRDHSLDSIDVLKIDIEGAEREVFADAAFLQRVGVVVIELHGDYDLDHFRRDMAQWGFVATGPDAELGTRMITARNPRRTGLTPVGLAPSR
jgi:FkbM family methyltransferase